MKTMVRYGTIVLAVLLVALGLASCGTGTTRAYVLRTGLTSDGMAFFGAGPDGQEVQNPVLVADVGDRVSVTLVNGDGVAHDVAFPDLGASTAVISDKGKSVVLAFTVKQPGTFAYICSVSGHRQAGMEGALEVAGTPSPGARPAPVPSVGAAQASTREAAPNAADIVREPTDLPGPLARTRPTHVRLDLVSVELDGILAKGTTFTYWTYNGKVPGPFFRVRLGDTVEVHLQNAANSRYAHSVDFHAVTGPGGGAVATQTAPGETTSFTFTPLNPGLYVYHCATPMVAEHIANGMYGMILVEPERGLPAVDREFYVMQGEIYTTGAFGEQRHHGSDVKKLLDEEPEYFVFNGAVGGLTEGHPLTASVGQTVRLYFGVGGPNFVSSFHVIGEVFDRAYNLGSLSAIPLEDVQTVLVPPGGSAVVDFRLEVPGRFILVDHALSRMQRGLAGWLVVEGQANPDIYQGQVTAGSGH
jgi:nitrite reductase (NO-forming)